MAADMDPCPSTLTAQLGRRDRAFDRKQGISASDGISTRSSLGMVPLVAFMLHVHRRTTASSLLTAGEGTASSGSRPCESAGDRTLSTGTRAGCMQANAVHTTSYW